MSCGGHSAAVAAAAEPSLPLYSLLASFRLQLRGFSDFHASSLMATFSFGCALGGLLGGTIGDKLGRRLPNSPNGRVLTNQFSVFAGLPMSFLLLKGMRQQDRAGSGGAERG